MNKKKIKLLMATLLLVISSVTQAANGANSGGGSANSGGVNGGLDDPAAFYDSQKVMDASNPQALEVILAETSSSNFSSGSIIPSAIWTPPAVSSSVTGTDLMNAWLAPNSGITYTNLAYVGKATQAAVYGAASEVGVFLNNSGIVLSTGDGGSLTNIKNTSTGYTGVAGTGGSNYVSAISGQYTYDSNALKFNFTLNSSQNNAVTSKFVFASEEYPEWTGIFKDGFALVVDGVNYAKFDANNFVSMNDLPSSAADVNSGDNKFMNNNLTSVAPFEFDGFTNTLTVNAFLNKSLSTHTFEVVIADSGDSLWDSAVFLSGLQATNLADPSLTGLTAPVPEPETYSMMIAGFGLICLMIRRRKYQLA
jgi:hypothetical protein